MQTDPTVHDPTSVHAHRRAVFRALLWFTSVFGVVFAIINYANGRYDFVVIELLVVGLALVLLPVAQRTRRLQTWIFVFLAPFFSAAMYVLATTAEAPTVFSWVLLFPIMSHLLLGRRLGGGLAAVALAVAGVVFFLKFGTHSEFSNPRAIGNVVLTSVSIFGFSHVYEVSRERAEHQLRQMAMTDVLTGLANRARLGDVFERELARFQRHGATLAVLMIDLDHFKGVNDRHGHDAGDAVLCRVADLLEQRLRPSDLACRLGGEEFCVVLADATLDDARVISEDLRRMTEASGFSYAGRTIDLSMSIGLAELGRDGVQLTTLLQAADARLYDAKEAGRNRVVG